MKNEEVLTKGIIAAIASLIVLVMLGLLLVTGIIETGGTSSNGLELYKSSTDGLAQTIQTDISDAETVSLDPTLPDGTVVEAEDGEVMLVIQLNGETTQVLTVSAGGTISLSDIETPAGTKLERLEFEDETAVEAVKEDDKTVGYKMLANTTAALTIAYEKQAIWDWGNDMEVAIAYEGDTVKTPENPEKDGYTFKGWEVNIAKSEQLAGVLAFDKDNEASLEELAYVDAETDKKATITDADGDGYLDELLTEDDKIVLDDSTARVNGVYLEARWTSNGSPEPASAELYAVKNLQVVDGSSKGIDVRGEFEFSLEAEGTAPEPDKLTASNPDPDGGKAVFGSVEFNKAGTYTYEVTESGEAENVSNDATDTKQMTITVSENRDGDLVVADAQYPQFTNVYTLPSESTYLPIVKEYLFDEEDEETADAAFTYKFKPYAVGFKSDGSYDTDAAADCPALSPIILEYGDPDGDGTENEVEGTDTIADWSTEGDSHAAAVSLSSNAEGVFTSPGIYAYIVSETADYSDEGEEARHSTSDAKYLVVYYARSNGTVSVKALELEGDDIENAYETETLPFSSMYTAYTRTADLEISKTVAGSLGDNTQDFPLDITLELPVYDTRATDATITVKDADGNDAATLSTEDGRVFTADDVAISNGETLKMAGLPKSTAFTVVEDLESSGVSGYSASYTLSQDTGAMLGSASRNENLVVEGEVAEGLNAVDIVNTYTVVVAKRMMLLGAPASNATTITKNYTFAAEDEATADGEFTFTFTPYAHGVDGGGAPNTAAASDCPAISDIVLEYGDGNENGDANEKNGVAGDASWSTSGDVHTSTADVEDVITSTLFPAAGVYYYTVEESGVENIDPTGSYANSEAKYLLIITLDNSDALSYEIRSMDGETVGNTASTMTFDNAYAPATYSDLTFGNTVTGELADLSLEFPFTVSVQLPAAFQRAASDTLTLSMADGTEYTLTTTDGLTFSASQVMLGTGDTATLEDLPVGTTFSITEDVDTMENHGYHSSYEMTEGSQTDTQTAQANMALEASGTVGDPITISFTSDYTRAAATGVEGYDPRMLFVLLASATAGMLARWRGRQVRRVLAGLPAYRFQDLLSKLSK